MKEYILTTRDGVTTVQLDEEDAELYGDAVKPVSARKKAAPANKAVTPENKSGVSDKQAEAASQAFNK